MLGNNLRVRDVSLFNQSVSGSTARLTHSTAKPDALQVLACNSCQKNTGAGGRFFGVIRKIGTEQIQPLKPGFVRCLRNGQAASVR